MEKSVENAINDIAVIKGIIERTQRDFSKISAFFVWIGVINLVFNVCVYTKTKPKNTSSKMEKIRNIITTHCFNELGWDAVGSGIIGDNAVEVWCITPDGKKGKSCIYKIDADDVNCYVNVNNINWGDVK